MTSALGSSEKDKERKFNTTTVSFFVSETTRVTNIKHNLLFYIPSDFRATQTRPPPVRRKEPSTHLAADGRRASTPFDCLFEPLLKIWGGKMKQQWVFV